MWKTVKLGDILQTGAGGTPLKSKKEFYEGGDIKWLLSGAVCERDIHDSKTYITQAGLDNSSAKVFPKNTVLIAMYGATAGQVGILQTEAATNQAVCGIYPSNDYLPEFLYYYLTNYKETLLLEVSGVAQPNLSQVKIKNIPLPVITLAEQKRSVAKLDAAFSEIDRAIEVAEAKEAEVEKLKASLLSDLLSGDAVMWATVKLGDVCELQPAKRQVRQRLNDGDCVSFMPMDCLGIDEIYPRAEKSKRLLEVYSSYTYFEDRDVLLAKITPCFENGKLGIANNLLNGVGFGSSEYIVLRCGRDILPEYVYYLLSQPSFRFEGKNNMSGAVGHKRVPKEFVANREISLPPLAEQQRIVAKLDAAFAEIDSAKQAIQRAKENHAALKAAILAQELTPPAESEAA